MIAGKVTPMTIAMHHTGFRGITDQEWQQLENPPGHRFEVIYEELVMTPSPSVGHAGVQLDLAFALQPFLPEGHRSLIGVEWRLVNNGLVAQAPQPDLMVVPKGNERITTAPLLAVEVLSPSDDQLLEHHDLTRIEGKRLDYAANGLQDYLEIKIVVDGPKRSKSLLVAVRYELVDGVLESVDSSSTTMKADRPFPYEFNLVDLER